MAQFHLILFCGMKPDDGSTGEPVMKGTLLKTAAETLKQTHLLLMRTKKQIKYKHTE